MPIAFQCQQCGENYNAADTLAGKKIKCRKCNAVVSVPAPQTAKPASAGKPAKAAPARPAAQPARPAAPAEPALDLLGGSLEPLMPPASSPLMAAGTAYSPHTAPKGRVKHKSARQRGPGVIQTMMMIGGTGLLIVLSAGVYAGAARFVPQRVASPKTGAEAVRGLPKRPVTSPGVGTPSSTKPSEDEDWEE